MILEPLENGNYIVIDWCEVAEDEIILGELARSPANGYWYYRPTDGVWLTCGHTKRISKHLAELNIGLRNHDQ